MNLITMKKVAIHQPNFLPWLGFFHKLSKVDTFVIFDHTQAPRGKSWFSRNYIKLNDEKKWLTIPIGRKGNKGLYSIKEVTINYENDFTRKHLNLLKHAYGKTVFFDEIYPIIEKIYIKKYKFLYDFNIDVQKTIADLMQIEPIYLSSYELVQKNPFLMDLDGNDLILQLSKLAGADLYISGTGCTDFINPNSFEKEKISFEFQQYICEEYDQIGKSFISHLSTIDALFNIGIENTLNLIKE